MSKALRKNDIKVLTDVEHVLLRSGMYIGSTAEESIETYIYRDDAIVLEPIPQIPGLLKIISEVLDNSLDEAIRTNFKFGTKIKVSYNNGIITIEDNGRGLPIEQSNEGVWVPELIFTKLRAGSNFDDSNKEAVVGMNGVGASLTAIFSKYFLIESANGHSHYKQKIENSLQVINKPKIKESSDNFTCIEFEPNYDYFKISDEAKSFLPLLIEKRVKDLAFAYPEITFYFNKEKINTSSLKKFLAGIHNVYECNENENCRVGLFYSDTDFQQISFVNGADTKRGGTHIDFAVWQIVEHLRVYLKKKHKIEVKPADIKSKLFILLSIRMKAPSFDSQTKERLITTPSNGFKSSMEDLFSKKFLNLILKNDEIILPIVEAYKLKEQVKENVKLAQLSKTGKRIKIDKFFPATTSNDYLVLTEGDSALSGLMPVLGRKNFSYFPLRGKPLNTLEAPINKISENEEMKSIINILNLNLVKDNQIDLTHKNILISTDQDMDGRSIRSLILCFFYRFAPSLIRENRIKFLRTPLIAAKKSGKIAKYFFDVAEYNEFYNSADQRGITYTYYKGLGTWAEGELEQVIEMDGIEHFIQSFTMEDIEDEESIKNWMSKERVESRKINLRGKEFDINSI